jgi:hypothetical protein
MFILANDLFDTYSEVSHYSTGACEAKLLTSWLGMKKRVRRGQVLSFPQWPEDL